jgi:hypothetical protein
LSADKVVPRKKLVAIGARGGNRNPGLRITGCGAPPLELLWHGADGDNRNLFSGLEAQGTPYIPRPLDCASIKLFSCQRPASCTLLLRRFQAGAVRTKYLKLPIKNKTGGHFLVAARFLKPVCYSKTVQVTSRTSGLTGIAVPLGSAPIWNIWVTHFDRNPGCVKIQAL